MNRESIFDLSAERLAVIGCVDAYESAAAEKRDDLRGFVDGLRPEFLQAAIEELIKVDLEYRWKAGRRKTIDEYLGEFPEIARNAGSSAALLQYESHLRSRTRPDDADSTRDSAPTEWDADRPVADMGQTSDLAPAGPEDATLVDAGARPGAEASAGPVTHIGRFRILKELGRGTFGVVYRCHDEQLCRDVAVKIPHPSRRVSSSRVKEFLHEAQVSARMRHPGIVTILETGTSEDGRGYIVYEFIQGTTLKDRMATGGFQREQAVLWVAQVAEALHHAHKNDLVHRDIKPANILIDEEEKTHLTDFGLAKKDDQFFTDDTGRALGTVAYMNPEQASGQAHWASPQSDIYSLGVVLYELLCGRRPFKAGSSLDLIQQVEHRPPAPPRTVDDSIPRPLEEICLKAMAKNPNDRYRTATDMAKALRQAVDERKPKPLLRMAVAVLAVAALVAGGFFLRPLPTPPPVPNLDPATITAALKWQARRGMTDPDTKILVDEHVPLVEENIVFMDVEFDREVFPYVIWFRSDGSVADAWPKTADADNQADQYKRNMMSWPKDSNGKAAAFELTTGGSGQQMIVVGTCDDALTKVQFDALVDDGVKLEDGLAVSNIVEWNYPPRQVGASPNPMRDGGGTRQSTAGDPVPVSVVDNSSLPQEFRHRLSSTFRSCYVIVFPVRSPGESSSGP